MNTVVSSHLLFMTLITTWFKNKHYALSVSSGFHMFSSLSIAISYAAVVLNSYKVLKALEGRKSQRIDVQVCLPKGLQS